MKFYQDRLDTFTSTPYLTSTSWPHKSPRREYVAMAGFEYIEDTYWPDHVKCTACGAQLMDWESNDKPLAEHIRVSPSCSFIKGIQEKKSQEAAEKEAQKPTPTPRDLAFFDPSLQFDFPKLRLYHNINKFAEHILQCADQYRHIDIIELLSKCLRGQAFVWSQSIQLKDVTLAKYMKVLTVKFRKPSAAAQETPKPASQTAPQMPQEYHKCTVCSASFSSISRLLTHSQMTTCNKASCKHCEGTFESKNQLHEHLRNECQNSTSQGKSKAPHKSSLSSLIIAESTTSSAECATSSPLSALPEYRAVSPSPPTYETASKNYLTVADLYMRYAPLKSAVSSRIRHPPITCKSVKSSWIRPVTCSTTVLPTLTVKDLYEKFHGKENPVISAVKWTPAHGRQIGFSAVKPACVTKTPTIDSNLIPHKGAKTRFFHSGKNECSATEFSTTTPYDNYLLRLAPSYSLWLPTTP